MTERAKISQLNKKNSSSSCCNGGSGGSNCGSSSGVVYLGCSQCSVLVVSIVSLQVIYWNDSYPE